MVKDPQDFIYLKRFVESESYLALGDMFKLSLYIIKFRTRLVLLFLKPTSNDNSLNSTFFSGRNNDF